MSARKAAWLVAYDVTSVKRLRRVHRYLTANAAPAQYSVFVTWSTTRELEALLEGLKARIHPKRDDVRAYRLPTRGWYEHLGRPTLPRGIAAAVEGERL